jgi:sugar-specific transcriptional regulator TrmB
MLEKILQKLNLKDSEIKVYKTVLFGANGSASRISLDLNLPRQTVYSILQRLLDEGLIRQSDKHGTKEFFATPEDLLSYSENQKKKFDTLAKDIEKQIPEMQIELQRHRKKLPKVEYYEGVCGMKRIFENILDQYKRGTEKNFRGYGINYYAESHMEEFVRNFIKERGELGVKTKLFIGKGENDFELSGSDDKYGRKIKHIDIEPQKSGVYLVGDRVYLFSYEDEVGVMVENKNIANFLKEIFEVEWRQSK